jgi:asparagine synthase (glutamine-hydrolysing)
MCGISGVYNYRDNQPVPEHLIKQMGETLAHRGPDDEGVYICNEAGIALSHRRLSIIDLKGGHQPMTNEDKSIWIVFNGEIYNYKSLSRELAALGHCFKSMSDTETIIHAYEEWGVDAFLRLNGMYACAIWDNNTHTLTLARDPFGIKPLYYWDNGKSVIFGSEIKAILCHPNVFAEVDTEALDTFLTLQFVPSPNTGFSGIKKVIPGHAMIYNQTGNSSYYFYRNVARHLVESSEEQLVEELRAKILTTIERQMVADVPVGVLLSGGLDSTCVLELMTRISGGLVNTFTVGFPGNFKNNELLAASATASRIGSQHYEVIISPYEYIDLFPKVMFHLEDLISDESAIPFYKVCQLSHEHVKVVLSGQGADEPFAGYPRHFGERYGDLYRLLPMLLRDKVVAPLIELLPRNERLKRAVRSLHIKDTRERLFQIYTIYDSKFKKRLYRSDIFHENMIKPSAILEMWQSKVKDLDSLSQMLYLDARIFLADNLLMYSDKLSMASSLEMRVPFLDLELMEFVERIPPKMKIKGLTQKYILKKAVSKWIPKEVTSKKKIGFDTPVASWLRKEILHSTEDYLLSHNSACRIYFKDNAISTILREHKLGIQDHSNRLHCLLTFEVWYRQFIKNII